MSGQERTTVDILDVMKYVGIPFNEYQLFLKSLHIKNSTNDFENFVESPSIKATMYEENI